MSHKVLKSFEITTKVLKKCLNMTSEKGFKPCYSIKAMNSAHVVLSVCLLCIPGLQRFASHLGLGL